MHAWVKPGDEVICTLRDGSRGIFKVSSVEVGRFITNEGRTIQTSEIADLRVKRLSPGKTVAAGVGVVAVALGAWIAQIVADHHAHRD